MAVRNSSATAIPKLQPVPFKPPTAEEKAKFDEEAKAIIKAEKAAKVAEAQKKELARQEKNKKEKEARKNNVTQTPNFNSMLGRQVDEQGAKNFYMPPVGGQSLSSTKMFPVENYITLDSSGVSTRNEQEQQEHIVKIVPLLALLTSEEKKKRIAEQFDIPRVEKNVNYYIYKNTFNSLDENYKDDNFTEEDILGNIESYVDDAEEIIKDIKEEDKKNARDIYKRKYLDMIKSYKNYDDKNYEDKIKLLEDINVKLKNKINQIINPHNKNTSNTKSESNMSNRPSLARMGSSPTKKSSSPKTDATITPFNTRKPLEAPLSPSNSPKAVAEVAAVSPRRTVTTPTPGNYQDSIVKKNIERIIAEKGYKKDGEPIIVSDSDGIAIYYLAAIDPYGTKVFINMRDVVGSIELAANDLRNTMKRKTDSDISASTRNFAIQSGHPVMLRQGSEYCAILRQDNGEAISESFVDTTECQNLKDALPAIPVAYPIVSANDISYNTKQTIERCLAQYQLSMKGLFEANKKKLEETITETKKLTDAIATFNVNRGTAYDSIVKNRQQLLDVLVKEKPDSAKREKIINNIKERNEAFESYATIYNEISKEKSNITKLYDNIREYNNKLVDIHLSINGKYIDTP